MIAQLNKSERPVLITLICILGFMGVVLSIYWITTGPEKYSEPWFIYYNMATAVLGLIFLTGIWKMRKWGANGYVVIALLNIVVLVFSNQELMSAPVFIW